MNASERNELSKSCDSRDERRLEHADEDFLGNVAGANAAADRLPPSQPIPRIGDRYTLISENGNPFKKFFIEITAIKDGWVAYRFGHIIGATETASCPLTAFPNIYEPTPETVTAREKGFSLPDWMAYVADQKQQAEDEARESDLRHDERTEARSWPADRVNFKE